MHTLHISHTAHITHCTLYTSHTAHSYTVFGLGNKTYEHYNEMGRLVDRKLQEMGATCVYERGEGDDDAKYVSSW